MNVNSVPNDLKRVRTYIDGENFKELCERAIEQLSMLNSSINDEDEYSLTVTLDLSKLAIVKFTEITSLHQLASILKNCNLEIYIPYVYGNEVLIIMMVFKDAQIILPYSHYCKLALNREDFIKDWASNALGAIGLVGRTMNKLVEEKKTILKEFTGIDDEKLNKIINNNEPLNREELIKCTENFTNNLIKFNKKSEGIIKIYNPVTMYQSVPSKPFNYMDATGFFSKIMRDFIDGKIKSKYPLKIYYNTPGGSVLHLQTEVEMIERLSTIFPKITIVCGEVCSLGTMIISEIMHKANHKVEVLNLRHGLYMLHRPMNAGSRAVKRVLPFDKTDTAIIDDKIADLFSLYLPVIGEEGVEMLVNYNDVALSNEDLKDIIPIEVY